MMTATLGMPAQGHLVRMIGDSPIQDKDEIVDGILTMLCRRGIQLVP